MAETWNKPPGYSGYEASTLGRIRSTQGTEPRILAVNDGRVVVYKLVQGERKRECVTVARLVLLAFVGKPPKGCLAFRFKGSDDRPSNLKWASRSELFEATQRCSRSSTPRRVARTKSLSA